MTLGHPAINLLLFRKKSTPEQCFAMLGVLLPDIFYLVASATITLLGHLDTNEHFYFWGQSLHSLPVWLVIAWIFYATNFWRDARVKYFCFGWILHILEDVISHRVISQNINSSSQRYFFPFQVKLDGFFSHELQPFNSIEILLSLAIFIVFRKNIWKMFRYALEAIGLRKN